MGAVSIAQMKANSKKQMRKARKILAKKRNSLPAVSIPIISDEKIEKIGLKIKIENKSDFLSKLHKFWSLKRRSRNGVPLIRRLQSNQMSRHNKEIETPVADANAASDGLTDRGNDRARMVYLKHLRNRLECLRLLVECIRKREKTKRDLLAVQEQFLKLYLQPFNVMLRRMMDELDEKDTMRIFLEPVNVDEVEDYAAIIKHPMDFQTMRSNIALNRYREFEHIEADFNLVVSNCLKYNAKDTVYYKAGVKLRDLGGQVIRKYKRKVDNVGIDKVTGRHTKFPPNIIPCEESTPKISSLEEIISEELKKTMSLKEQLDKLLLYNDMLNDKHTRKTNLSKTIGKEVSRLRKEIISESRNIYLTSPTTKRMTQNSNQSPCQALPLRTRRTSSHAVQPPQPQPRANPESCDNDTDGVDVSSCSKDESMRSPTPELDAEDTLPLSTPDKEAISSSNFVLSPSTTRKSQPNKTMTSLPSLTNEINEDEKQPPKFKNAASSLEIDNLECTSPPVKKRKCQPTKRDISLDHKKCLSPGATLNSALTVTPASFLQYRAGGAVHSSELDTATSDGESARTSSSTSCSPSSEDELIAGQVRNVGTGQTGTNATADQNSFTTGLACLPPSGDLHGDLHGITNHPLMSVLTSDTDASSTTSSSRFSRRCKDQEGAGSWRGYSIKTIQIISPSMQSGFFHNGVPIPSPPQDVLALRSRHTPNHSLVLFFDHKRTWQWLPRSKLEPLGVDSGLDKAKQEVNKRANIRRNVQRAYYDAIQHRCRVTGEQNCLVEDYC